MKITARADNLPVYKQVLKLENAINEYLDTNGFLRLRLPVLSPALIPESYLEVFRTEYRYMDEFSEMYLTPSPELFIKRLLCEGVGDCYYLGSSFRNGEQASPRHASEFTMLEIYKTGVSYLKMATIVLDMIGYAAQKMYGKPEIAYNGQIVRLDSWEKLTVAEAFWKYASISEETLFDKNEFITAAGKKGYLTSGFTYEDLFSQIYAHEIEPYLGTNGKPTLLYEYPVTFAALSAPNPDGKTAQRFEWYIHGIELGNCYRELTDWKLQEQRLQTESALRKKSGKIKILEDDGFIAALQKGMPETSGIAIGFDRLAMVFTDSKSVHEVVLLNIT